MAIEDYYELLGVPRTCSIKEVRRAYVRVALGAHPDKGGSPDTFARIQAAYEVLKDPKRRSVYDTCDLPRVHARAGPGKGFGSGFWGAGGGGGGGAGGAAGREDGEPIQREEVEECLLRFRRMGLHIDPRTQLVCLCGNCGRPACKTCWICKMDICDFCTLKPHHRGEFPSHYPLINAPGSMELSLAQKELERKKEEDAQALERADPHFRNEAQLRFMREFKEAAVRAHFSGPSSEVTPCPILSKFYMWAQTDRHVYVACHVPSGFSDAQLFVGVEGGCLVVQAEDSAPLLRRRLAGAIKGGMPGAGGEGGGANVFMTEDRRYCTITLAKASPGDPWPVLFRGDSTGSRCLHTPYTVHESDSDVLIEIPVPFYTEAEDVHVDIGPKTLEVRTRQGLDLRRTLWVSQGEESRRGAAIEAVCHSDATWTLESDMASPGGGGGGGLGKSPEGDSTLVIMLPRPPPPANAAQLTAPYSRVFDNRAAERAGGIHGSGKKGFRVFVEDEDLFGLEDFLGALVFMELGSVRLPRKPWEKGVLGSEGAGGWTEHRAVGTLPPGVQRNVRSFLKAAVAGGGG